LRVAEEMLTLIGEARMLAAESGAQRDLANQLPEIAERLERLTGSKPAQSGSRTTSCSHPMSTSFPEQGGIDRTKEFEKKGLATYAVNVGLGCGHDCCYCSSPSLRRMHPEFQRLEHRPYTSGALAHNEATRSGH
jgi:hypothetical protein